MEVAERIQGLQEELEMLWNADPMNDPNIDDDSDSDSDDEARQERRNLADQLNLQAPYGPLVQLYTPPPPPPHHSWLEETSHPTCKLRKH